jgi:ribosome-associated translation inhibitor RaiA
VDSRTRAYVEYRVFDTLRSIERELRGVDVSLSDQSMGAPRVVTCTIVLDFSSRDRIVATATADWPYAAIDRAVREAWRQIQNRAREATVS